MKKRALFASLMFLIPHITVGMWQKFSSKAPGLQFSSKAPDLLDRIKENFYFSQLLNRLEELRKQIPEGESNHKYITSVLEAIEIVTTLNTSHEGTPEPRSPGTARAFLQIALDRRLQETTHFGSGGSRSRRSSLAGSLRDVLISPEFQNKLRQLVQDTLDQTEKKWS